MRILNICFFASANEIGILILYFTKLISEFKKIGKHCKIFSLLYKTFMSKQRIFPLSRKSLPLIPTPHFLEKIFHPHPYCQIRGTQEPL